MTIAEQIAALHPLGVSALRERYAELFGEPTRVGHKQWLIKRLAWRLQMLAEGDLTDRARRRAAELANDADLRLSAPKPPSEPPVSQPIMAARRTVPGLPIPGTILARPYKGKILHVRVLAQGFEYEGTTYRSLSALAKTITGSHCNGFWFFGLRKKERRDE